MRPIVYTTYGIAMGHRSETLANSGGLRPVGTEPMGKCLARVGVARALKWLGAALAWGYPRHKDADGGMIETGETMTAALPSRH